MKKSYILCFFALICIVSEIQAQSCGGAVLFKESFEQGMPSSWTVLPFDGNPVYATMIPRGFTGQWQVLQHLGQTSATNTSRYGNSGSTDDWMISPAITLPATNSRICLSWLAATGHDIFPESYEILVSTTTPTVANFTHSIHESVDFAGEKWVAQAVDLDAFAGQTLYLAFHHFTQGSRYALYLDDINISLPQDKDLGVSAINGNAVQAPGLYTLHIDIQNGGNAVVDAFDVEWWLDDVPQPQISISTPIQAGEIQKHIFQTNTQVDAGLHTIKVRTKISNGADNYPENDTKEWPLLVGTRRKQIMIEEFTQASCPPCAALNPVFEAAIDPYMTQKWANALKFHTAWPGYDPMYLINTSVSNDRAIDYGIVGVPSVVLNGQQEFPDCPSIASLSCVESALLDKLAAEKTVFQLDAKHWVANGKFHAVANLLSDTEMPLSNVRLHGYIMEDYIEYDVPPGNNGELTFGQVVRAALTPLDGQLLSALSAGETHEFNFSQSLKPEWQKEQLRAIFFIQYDVTNDIWQSTLSQQSSGTQQPELAENTLLVAPVPTFDRVNLSWSGNTPPESIEVYDSYGRLQAQLSGAIFDALGKATVDLSSRPAGMYWIKVVSTSGFATVRAIRI